MDSIDWRLEELKPPQGDSFNTLSEWFDSRSNQFMDYHFREGWRHHKRNIRPFTQADSRERGETGNRDVMWRRQMARRLFGLRHAINEASIPTDRYIKVAYPREHPLYNHFWLLRNCRPYCGSWTAPNLYLYGGRNPTGKPCGSRLCPWCWMRRFDVYVKACRTPWGRQVRTYGFPNIAPKGLNHNGLVSVTSFDYYRMVSSHDDPFLSDTFNYYIPRAAKSFNQIRLGPKDPYTLRLTAPLYQEAPDPETGVIKPLVGIRVGFIHTDAILEGAWAYPVSHFNYTTVEDAIRWTYPYPIGWLESENFLRIKLKLLMCFHKVSHHGIVKTPLPRIQNVRVLHRQSDGTRYGTIP